MHLALTNVCAAYGSRIVLDAITVQLTVGDVLVVTGANGSGKSTLLRLLCGLQRPLSGSIVYEHAAQSYVPQMATHLIGWVSPDVMLYRELTAYENLRFFAAVRGVTSHQHDLDALLTYVGLGGRGNDYVAAYSSGMVHRLRYAYALLHQPPVLLLDEPTVMLDEKGIDVVSRVVATQRTRGITVIATNDQRELRFGDYVLTLGSA